MLVIPESPYFTIEEFAVSAAHPELVETVPPIFRGNVERLVRGVLHPLRIEFGGPMRVLSGYRPHKLNAAVGGSLTSQHRLAQAADIGCSDPLRLFRLAMQRRHTIEAGQIIAYPKQGFVHFATPSRKYPVPTFFVSQASKVYTPVDDEAGLERVLAA